MHSFTSHLNGWYDVSDQMRADIHRRAADCFRAREEQKNALRTVADFEAYRADIRDHFLEAIGGLPEEKTPLRPQVTGVVQQAGFRIEKILFESSPQYLVSAACYVPDCLEAPAPAVLFLCGHSANGKAHDTYQMVCRDLARNGFIVLAIDPIGQGERLQYWHEGQPRQQSCTVEHTHAGLPFFLQGASVARHFVWDAIRGVDYLESRADVDPARIGVTGNSGGGTQTCFLMLVEPRLAAAVPATFPMTLETMLKTGQPQDMEQIVPRCIERGPDHDDFLTAIAPRPVLAGAVAYDSFPIEGTHEAVRRAKRIYELYGRPEGVQIAVDDALHCYSDGLRQACVNWFKEHLKNEAPDFVTAHPGLLPDEELNAAPSGQVLRDFAGAATIIDLGNAYLETLPAPARSPHTLRLQLDDVLGVSRSGERAAPIYPRLEKAVPLETGGSSTKIWFFSAPDIAVSGVLYAPPGAEATPLPATILLREKGTAECSEAWVRELLDNGRRVFVFDVRGVGGVATRSVCSPSLELHSPFNTEYRLACDAAMLGLSTVGLRVFDILRAFDYLKTRRDIGDIALHGVDAAAVWAYYAAALEPGIAGVTCENMLVSYRDLCRTPRFDHDHFNLRIMAWGLLRCGDIADLRPCLEPRPLRFLAPRDPENGILASVNSREAASETEAHATVSPPTSRRREAARC